MLPLPAAAWLARGYFVLLCAYAAELLCTGRPLMALFAMLLVLATRAAFGRLAPQGVAAPRRLLVTTDGSLYIATVGGDTERAGLAAESLWLGRAVLLKIHTPGATCRLLLGAGNVDPASLAALRRRLRGARCLRGDGVNSAAVVSHGGAIEDLPRISLFAKVATRTFRRIRCPFNRHARLPPGGEV